MKTHFDQGWKDWIRNNVASGGDKDGIFRILSDEGYDYQAIKKEMNHEPSVPLCEIANPLIQVVKPVDNTGGPGKPVDHGVPTDGRYIYLPNANRLDTDRVELWWVDGFLLARECERLVELIKSRLEPSTVTSPDPDKAFRTSRTCHMDSLADPLIARVEARISAYLGIEASYAETMQGQYYEVGQEFKPHTDFFSAEDMAVHDRSLGQRTWTFMIYLNDVEEGGETLFPELKTGIRPKAGRAVIWNSLHPDGSPNPYTLHHGTPVARGCKAIITKWFRSRSARQPAPPMYCKSAQEYVPNYTKTGIRRAACPPEEFEEMLRFYRQNARHLVAEPSNFIYGKSKDKTGSSMVHLPEPLRNKIQDNLKPMLEAWAGVELEPIDGGAYGIRVYHDGAVLECHRDAVQNQVIGGIIQVAQDVRKDWPIAVQDNYYRTCHVLLKPGEMLLYESARLLHGRPLPLEGESYASVYVHYKPVGFVPKELKDYPQIARQY